MRVGKKCGLLTGQSHEWSAFFTGISSQVLPAAFIKFVNFLAKTNGVVLSFVPQDKIVGGHPFLTCSIGENSGCALKNSTPKPSPKTVEQEITINAEKFAH